MEITEKKPEICTGLEEFEDTKGVYKSPTRIPKSSNQNAVFFLYDVLIGCFQSMSTRSRTEKFCNRKVIFIV